MARRYMNILFTHILQYSCSLVSLADTIECYHRTKAMLLALRKLVLRMRRQSWIQNLWDAFVLFQKQGYGHGISVNVEDSSRTSVNMHSTSNWPHSNISSSLTLLMPPCECAMSWVLGGRGNNQRAMALPQYHSEWISTLNTGLHCWYTPRPWRHLNARLCTLSPNGRPSLLQVREEIESTESKMYYLRPVDNHYHEQLWTHCWCLRSIEMIQLNLEREEAWNRCILRFLKLTFRVGLVGVSSHNSLALAPAFSFDAICSLINSMSSKSKNSMLMFMAGLTIFLKYRCVPPYTSSIHRILWPCDRRWTTAEVAALPDAKATQCFAFSAAAIARSKAPLVGFPVWFQQVWVFHFDGTHRCSM